VWTYSHYANSGLQLSIAEGDVREFRGDALLCGDHRRLNLGLRPVRQIEYDLGVKARIELCEDPESRWRVILSQRLNPKTIDPYLGTPRKGSLYVDGLQTKVYMLFMALIDEGFKSLERIIVVPMGWRQPELTALTILGAVTGFASTLFSSHLKTETKEVVIVSAKGALIHRDLLESGKLSSYLNRNRVFNYPERVWVQQSISHSAASLR
jgi:hypothetical protein